MKLTKRLAAAAAMVHSGSTIADIGTDHGYLPVALCQDGICPQAVAADIVPGPLAVAVEHVRQAGLEARIDCRLGDGLQCLRPGEVDGAVICGMGGSTICAIMEASPAVVQSLDYLVLQPMIGQAALRQYIYDSHWHIADEQLVWEECRLYEVIKAVPGEQAALPYWLNEVGPINWQRQGPYLLRHIEGLIKKWQGILEGLHKSHSDVATRIFWIEQHIKELEGKAWQCNCKK